MKRSLLAGALVLGLIAPALAQNTVPQVGVTSGYLAKSTYSSAFFGLVPPASATDIICIAGSATKTVRLQGIRLSGSGTAISIPVTIVKRASVDTGGTPAATTANPGVVTQIMKRDSGNAAATATLISYTANPTITDTAPTYLDSFQMAFAAAATGPAVVIVLDYSRDAVNLQQLPTLKSAAEQICINFNGATVTSPLLTGSIAWTEE